MELNTWIIHLIKQSKEEACKNTFDFWLPWGGKNGFNARPPLINSFLFVVFILILFMIMIININNLLCILFVQLSSVICENFKALAWIIPEILECIELLTYKLGLVNILSLTAL